LTLLQVQGWFGVGPTPAVFIAAGMVLLLAVLAYYIGKFVLLRILYRLIRRTRTDWDDILLVKRVPQRALHVLPIIVIYFFIPTFPRMGPYLHKLCLLYGVAVAASVLSAFLNAVEAIYDRLEVARSRPIKGVVQIVKIILWLMAAIVFISVLIEQSPVYLLSGLGAMTAVLLLVFKDTILGIVAGLQLSMNNLVQIGDWLEVPQFGADGVVVDVALHTVQIQNWDMTVTAIPTYKLMEGAFKNWRGMQSSGGRRIMRAVNIDIGSIRFCDDEMLARFRGVRILQGYLDDRLKQVRAHNEALGSAQDDFVNGRRRPNIGTFRAYLIAWLKEHPRLRQDMTFLVRQLKTDGQGLPIEIYVFANTTAWAEYEDIQAQIFDHVLAIVPFFGLRVWQQPAGNDIREAIHSHMIRS